VRAESIENIAADSEIIFLAVPWPQAEKTIKSLGYIKGKILVDCTNPLNADLRGLDVEPNTSAAEQIAGWAKGARVVKAFNTVGSSVMANAQFGEDKATLFICGDDPQSKSTVEALAKELSFDVLDTGSIQAARYLEQMAALWIHLAFDQKMGTDFALKVLTR